jgi:hypothetical protein
MARSRSGPIYRCANLEPFPLLCRPKDFLYYSPSARSEWVHTNGLTPLMLDMWQHWADTPLTTTINNALTLQGMLDMPVWLQRHPLFLQPSSRGQSTCLAHALRHNRPFYSHIAGLGFCCLNDFFLPNGTWPNANALDRLLWPDVNAHVEDWPSHVRFLHSKFTNLLRQIYGHFRLQCT